SSRGIEINLRSNAAGKKQPRRKDCCRTVDICGISPYADKRVHIRGSVPEGGDGRTVETHAAPKLDRSCQRKQYIPVRKHRDRQHIADKNGGAKSRTDAKLFAQLP